MKNIIDELNNLANRIEKEIEGTDGGYPDGIRTAVGIIQERVIELNNDMRMIEEQI